MLNDSINLTPVIVPIQSQSTEEHNFHSAENAESGE